MRLSSIVLGALFGGLFTLAFGQAVPPVGSVSGQALTVLPAVGPIVPPAPEADPPVPTNLAAAPPGTNLRLWIFDPRNRTAALGSPGIFIAPANGSFVFRAASPDGSLYLALDNGAYQIDVVEPASLSSLMSRRRYAIAVSGGVASMTDKTPDARGFFAVTVVYRSAEQAARLSALTARATESALTFNPLSSCQLIDQITPTRSLSTDLSAGFPRVRTRLPSHGRIKALIVPIEFPDLQSPDTPPTLFAEAANGTRDYFLAASYGRLAMDFYIPPNWLRVPFNSTQYLIPNSGGRIDHSAYRNALVALTDTLFDYNLYDAVYFVLPKEAPVSSFFNGPAITSPLLTRNGYITNGATGGGDMYLPQNSPGGTWKWMAHETGHAFGLYDQNDGQRQTLGEWSIMAAAWSKRAIELGAWDRHLLGWLGTSQVTCLPKHQLTTTPTVLKLNPIVRQNADLKTVLIPLSPTSVLVLESRKAEGLDLISSTAEGVLAYTVDMTLGQLRGGYRIQPRPGSTDTIWYADAALRAGDSITVDGVVVTVNQTDASGDTVSIRAVSNPTAPTLAVLRSGLGYGTVTSSPAGINCTPTCFASYTSGANVTLTATPAAGFQFIGWSGDCAGRGTCTVPVTAVKNVNATFYGTTATSSFSGLWWVAAESGWGMSLTQRAGVVFMAWYTYDTAGAPVWYVMPNCAVDGNGCRGEIYSVSGGQPLTTVWSNPTLNVSTVGQGSFAFSDANTGTFSFTLNGVSGAKNMTRQSFSAATTSSAVDYTGLFWAAPANSESGWGTALTQQGSTLFAALYTYDAQRRPIWYVASNCVLAGAACTGDLYQVNGGRSPTVAWGAPALAVRTVGQVSINFTDANTGVMTFTIDGSSGRKNIVRQTF